MLNSLSLSIENCIYTLYNTNCTNGAIGAIGAIIGPNGAIRSFSDPLAIMAQLDYLVIQWRQWIKWRQMIHGRQMIHWRQLNGTIGSFGEPMAPNDLFHDKEVFKDVIKS